MTNAAEYNIVMKMMAKAAKTTALTGGAIVGTAALAGVILWDADFYQARDKWETFKLAMFGEWQPNRKSCASDLLDGVAEFSFFKRAYVAGFGSVMTGAKYTSAQAVIDKRPANQWCYVSIGNGVSSRHVELATQTKSAPPTFNNFHEVPQAVLGELGVSTARLSSLAKANCRFANSSIENKD